MKKNIKLLVLVMLFPAAFYAQRVGINTLNPQSILDINGDVIFRTADLTVTDSMTAALDVNTFKFSSYRVQSDSTINIAGITAGMDGRVVTLTNTSEYPMWLHHDHQFAPAGNRILTRDGASLVLHENGIVTLQYDTSAMKWLVNSANQLPFGTCEIEVADSITAALDVNTRKCNSYRLLSDSTMNFAGITASMDGRVITLSNGSEWPMWFHHDHQFALADNRILTGDGASLVLHENGIVTLQYDSAAMKWLVNSYNQLPFGTCEIMVADSITAALDVNTRKCNSYRLLSDSTMNFAGITAGMDGRVITLSNGSEWPMWFHHDHQFASPDNRILTGDGASLVLHENGIVTLQYDSAAMKWLVNSFNQLPFGTCEIAVADSITAALDVNTANCNSYRILSDSTMNFAGITAGIDGRVISLTNGSEWPMWLHHNHQSASAGNRILTGDGASLVLHELGIVTLQYDTSAMRWLVNSSSHVPAGATVWDTTSNGIFTEEFVGIGTDSPVAPLTILTGLDEPGFTHMAGEDSVTVESSISEMLGSVGTSSNHMFTLKANDQGAAHVLPNGNFILGTTSQASQVVGQAAIRMPEYNSKITVFTPINVAGYLNVGGDNIVKVEQGITGSAPFGYDAYMGTITEHPFRLRAGAFSQDFVHIYPNYKMVLGGSLDAAVGTLTAYSGGDGLGFVHVGQLGPVLRSHCGQTSASFGTTGPHNLRLVTDNQTRLHIGYTGYVGIGTEEPVELLTVFTNTTNEIFGRGFSHRNHLGLVLASHLGGVSASFGTRSNHRLRLVANEVDVMTIHPNGNVGIGMDDPTQKLAVNGTIRSKEVIVETANWPDYVFHENYELRSLRDLEDFIIENNHLPNIPSAADMETNGIHVGETQKKMMEKIEELTLYILALNKKIETLEKKCSH